MQKNSMSPMTFVSTLILPVTFYSTAALAAEQACHDAYWSDDWSSAYQYCSLAANDGDAESQKNLGWLYSNGRGVLQDYAEAIKWYRLAADQGNAVAQFNLGGAYIEGRGVPSDPEKAAEFFKLAADQGYASAQFNLGMLFENGTGLEQSDHDAVRFFTMAALQGHEMAEQRLRGMYEEGRGVGLYHLDALRWIGVAAERGERDAIDLLEMLLRLLKGEQEEEVVKSELNNGIPSNSTGEPSDDLSASEGDVKGRIEIVQAALLQDTPSCWSAATMENKDEKTISVRLEGTAFDTNGHFINNIAYNFNNVRPGSISSQQSPIAEAAQCAEVQSIRYRVGYCSVNGERSDVSFCENRIYFRNDVSEVTSVIDGIQ